MEECLPAGLQAPTLTFWCILISSLFLDFGYPPNCHSPSYLVLSLIPAPNGDLFVKNLGTDRQWEVRLNHSPLLP